jgi:hypothetical protein
MEYIVKVTGLAQVEQFLKMDAESEEEAIIEVNKYELWNDGVWKFVQLNDIDSVDLFQHLNTINGVEIK